MSGAKAWVVVLLGVASGLLLGTLVWYGFEFLALVRQWLLWLLDPFEIKAVRGGETFWAGTAHVLNYILQMLHQLARVLLQAIAVIVFLAMYSMSSVRALAFPFRLLAWLSLGVALAIGFWLVPYLKLTFQGPGTFASTLFELRGMRLVHYTLIPALTIVACLVCAVFVRGTHEASEHA